MPLDCWEGSRRRLPMFLLGAVAASSFQPCSRCRPRLGRSERSGRCSVPKKTVRMQPAVRNANGDNEWRRESTLVPQLDAGGVGEGKGEQSWEAVEEQVEWQKCLGPRRSDFLLLLSIVVPLRALSPSRKALQYASAGVRGVGGGRGRTSCLDWSRFRGSEGWDGSPQQRGMGGEES
eukprot:7712753-Alexandrium_andersonii.AAC.2